MFVEFCEIIAEKNSAWSGWSLDVVKFAIYLQMKYIILY